MGYLCTHSRYYTRISCPVLSMYFVIFVMHPCSCVVKNTIGDPTCVNGGMYYRAVGTHQAKICIGGKWTAIGVPRVTSLPSNPSDGDEVYYVVNSPEGGSVGWHARYDASISGSYKWVVLGAAPLYNRADGGDTWNSTWYTKTLTGGASGPSIYIPRGGIYDVTVGAAMHSSVQNGYTFMSFSAPGVTADDNNSVMQLGPGINAQRRHMFTSRVTITSSGTLAAEYRVVTGTGNFASRRIFATPIRLAE